MGLLGKQKPVYVVLRTLVALLLALIIGGIVIYVAGFNPLQAYKLIFKGAFGSVNAILTIQDEAVEARMKAAMIRLMKENEAPAEQYTRLGLEQP